MLNLKTECAYQYKMHEYIKSNTLVLFVQLGKIIGQQITKTAQKPVNILSVTIKKKTNSLCP